MGTQLLEQIVAGDDVGLAPLTVEQYHQMIANGILGEGSQIELLDGLLVLKDRRDRGGKPMNVGPRHVTIVFRLSKLMEKAVETHPIYVRVQSPITLQPDNEPEPDIAIVHGSPDDYANRHPGPTEVPAVMEVADSSLHRDRGTKLQVYANAGIETYWIVNLLTNQIEVYNQPQIGGGQYAQTEIFSPGDEISWTLPDGRVVAIPVSDILP